MQTDDKKNLEENTNKAETEDISPKKPNRLISIVKKTLKAALYLVFIFSLLVVLILVFPYHILATPALSAIEHSTGIQIDANVRKISLLTGISIQNLQIQHPSGFDNNPASIDNFTLSYSLLHMLLNRELVIDEISIDSPKLFYEETDDGYSNIQALLEKISGPEAEEPKQEKKEESGKVANSIGIRVQIKKFRITNIAAHIRTKDLTADISGFNVLMHADAGPDTNRINAAVELGGGKVHINRPDAIANIQTPWKMKLSMHGKDDIQANINLPFLLHDSSYKQSKLPNSKLVIGIVARANLKQDRATIDSTRIVLNETTTLLDLSATLQGLTKQEKKYHATIKQLGANLDEFGPWIAALGIPIKASGSFYISESSITGTTTDKLPSFDLHAIAKSISVQHGKNLHVNNLNLTLNAKGNKEKLNKDANEKTFEVDADASLTVDSLRAAENRLGNTAMDLTTHATLEDSRPQSANLNLMLDLHGVENPTQKIKLKRVSLNTTATANLKTGNIELQIERLDIPQVVSVRLNAELNEFGRKGNIKPLSVNAPRFDVLYRMARTMKLTSGIQSASGSLNLRLSANWKMEWKKFLQLLPKDSCEQIKGLAGKQYPQTQQIECKQRAISYRMPGRAKIKATIKKVSLCTAKNEVCIKNLSSSLDAGIRGNKINATAQLSIDSAITRTQIINGLVLNLDAKASPSKAWVGSTMSIDSFADSAQKAKVSVLGMNIDATVPLHRFKPAKRGDVSLKLTAENITKDERQQIHSFVFDMAAKLKKNHAQITASALAKRIEDTKEESQIDGLAINLTTEADIDKHFMPSTSQLQLEIDTKKISSPQKLPMPLEKSSMTVRMNTPNGFRDVVLKEFSILIPTIGMKAALNGKLYPLVYSLAPFKMSDKPNMDASLFISLSQKNSLNISGAEISGTLGLKGNLNIRGDIGNLNGSIRADDFRLHTETKSELTGQKTEISIERFDTNIPFSQQFVLRPKFRLKPADTSIASNIKRSNTLIYDALREYADEKGNFKLRKLLFMQSMNNTLQRKILIDSLDMDMQFAQNNFAIDAMHMQFLDGDITGKLKIFLPPEKPSRPMLDMNMQMTGINLAYLNVNKKREEITSETEVSAIMNTSVNLLKKELEGRIDITQISMKQLDQLLVFMDPQGVDPKIQKNRETLKLASIVKPRVELVSIWIAHENLNMDITMSSLPLVQQGLQHVLDKLKIRRYSIAPIIKSYMPKDEDEKETETGKADETARK